ncbi:type II secretion system protein [Salimicrobium jeotgali]|uniref:type II secretion system protein n=1 Tax=Salimicrobium jeotgali TaxID=1230341 RepID=UPI000C850A78|nr:type II secretion system protein [Salimicrobium jeotgali]
MNNKGFILLEAVGTLALITVFTALIFPSFITVHTSLNQLKEEREILMLLHNYTILDSHAGKIEYKYPVTVLEESHRYCARWENGQQQELCLYD